jgi:heme oxygenase (mycobilin-producing)
LATTTILEMRFKPDAVAEAPALLQRILDETRAFDGCLGVTVIEDKDDPTHLIAIEQWESLEKDDAYREWRAGDGAIAELPAMLAAAPSLAICKIRSDI